MGRKRGWEDEVVKSDGEGKVQQKMRESKINVINENDKRRLSRRYVNLEMEAGKGE